MFHIPGQVGLCRETAWEGVLRTTKHAAWMKSIAVCLLLGAAVLPASAQITTGNVTGTVHDAQGAVVPGATGTLIDEARGTKLPPPPPNRTATSAFRTPP